jgi:hypothetical protein
MQLFQLTNNTYWNPLDENNHVVQLLTNMQEMYNKSFRKVLPKVEKIPGRRRAFW